MIIEPIRILLLEDSPVDAELVCQELAQLAPPPMVTHVDNGAAFEKALSTEPDLILSDFNIPGFGGIEAITMAKAALPNVPFIFVSGTIGEELAVDLLLRGAADYVLKERLRKLLPSVQRALKQSEETKKNRLLQKQLREAESRYSSLYNLSLDGIFIHDFAGRFVDANERTLEILGYTSKELLEMSFADIVGDEKTSDIIDLTIREIMATGRQEVVREYLFKRKDGADVWVEASGSIILSSGHPVAIHGVMRDITGRKLRDLEIRKLFLSVENSRDLIMITDRAGQIEYVNHAATDLTGYSKAELIGRTPAIMKSGMLDADFYKRMWEALLSGQVFSDIFINRKKSGELIYLLQTITPLYDDTGKLSHFISTSRDLTAQRGMEDKLNRLAWHDALTELPNRYSLLKRIAQSIELNPEYSGSLIFLDIDRYDRINQVAGYETGDAILQHFAALLNGLCRPEDFVARVGTDEFAFLLPNSSDMQRVEQILKALRKELRAPIRIGEQEYTMTVSAGIARFPEHARRPDELIHKARSAMVKARQNGRNTHRYYEESIKGVRPEVLRLEQKLFRSLDNREFSIVYQPYWRTDTRELAGMEALMRWTNDEFGFVSPAVFIPLLEETGMIIDVGKNALQIVCEQIAEWKKQGLPVVPVSVNLSPMQFRQIDLSTTIFSLANGAGISPSLLNIEITESAFMEDAEYTQRILHQLREAGMSISIDDFGTGYSSLSYLKRFPVNHLKIDISFVRDIARDGEMEAIVRAIIGLAENLHLKTIAEGVETEEQGSILKLLGADYLQGYLLSKPITAADVTALLARPDSGVIRA